MINNQVKRDNAPSGSLNCPYPPQRSLRPGLGSLRQPLPEDIAREKEQIIQRIKEREMREEQERTNATKPKEMKDVTPKDETKMIEGK